MNLTKTSGLKKNKLLLNITKANYSLFQPVSKNRFLREPLPFIKMDKTAVERGNVAHLLVYLLMKTSHGNST